MFIPLRVWRKERKEIFFYVFISEQEIERGRARLYKERSQTKCLRITGKEWRRK